MKSKNASILLFLASFIWGIAFIFQRTASSAIGPCFFNGIRMLLGCIALLPVGLANLNKHKNDKEYLKTVIMGGIVCGIATAAPSILQQTGIAYTTAGKAGFLTSLYILFIPIISIFMKKKVSLKVWICVFFGIAGAYLLSVGTDTGINKGDILVITCAVLFAFQMIFIEHYAAKTEGPDLSTAQFFFSGLTCLLLGLFIEPFSFSQVKDCWFQIIYTGVFSCGIAYTLQIVGQKYVPVEKASLPLSLENAWAAIAGAVILKETMNIKEILGCLILFGAVIISQLPDKRTK